MNDSDIVLRRALEAVSQLARADPPWKDILEGALNVVGADSASFLVFEGSTVVDVQTLWIDGVAETEYMEHFHALDILLKPPASRDGGAWFDSERSLPVKTRADSEYYTDFMLKHRMRQMLSFQVEDGTQSAGITLQRANPSCTPGEGPSGDAVAKLTDAMRSAFSARKAAAKGYLDVVDSLDNSFGAATLLVDERGALVHANAGGRLLLEKSSTLSVRSGALWHNSIKVRNALTTALRQALRSVRSIRLTLKGRDGSTCTADIARADGRLRFGPPLLLVRLNPSCARAEIQLSVLCAQMDITAGQGEVLLDLLNGATPEDISVANGVTLNTVRKHIALLMEKTGCTRQSDLVRMALGGLSVKH